VVLIISDKYLKSPNCMFELLEVQRNGNIYDRILPVVLSDANIYKSIGIISYLKYWEAQIEELNHALKELESFADTQGIRDDIDLYTDIRGAIAALATLFRNMNTLNLDELRSKEYAPLLKMIDSNEKPTTTPDPIHTTSHKEGKILYHIPDMMQLETWTRCIVRLAWDEILLEEGLNLDENEKVIENIRLGKVMEVCIEETKNEDNFEIFSNSSKEQFISEDDFTEWIFDVKAKTEGTFTLVIKVSLIQIIEGFGERKKDIVLERSVKTEAFAPAAVTKFDSVNELFLTVPNQEVIAMPPLQSEPIPTFAPVTEAPKKVVTFKKILPYAASIMLLSIASVAMWPELKSTFEEEPTSVTEMETHDSTSAIPPEASVENPVENSQEFINPPIQISPPQVNPDMEFPKSGTIEMTLPKTRLVLIGIKKGPPTDGIALENNDFLFLVEYNSLYSLTLNSSVITFYSLKDTARLTGMKIKEVKVSEIKDSVKLSKPNTKWRIKPMELTPGRIHN